MSTFVFGAVNDGDESLKGKSGGGKFGLNTGTISKLEYVTDAGKDKSPGDAVDIHVLIGEREIRRRIYDITGELFGKKDTKYSPGDPEYAELYNAAITQNMAVITHAVKAVGVTPEMIGKALAVPATSFVDWVQKMLALLPSNYPEVPVDIFLEYQWKIAEGQDKTYLEVAKNMKGGAFLKPAITAKGTWTTELSWVGAKGEDVEGLRYIDDAGNIHPFTRTQAYMESPKGYQQGDGAAPATTSKPGIGAPAAGTPAKKANW